MNLFFRFLILCILFFETGTYAQFEFSGEVNQEFINSKVYLLVIDDYEKIDLFLTNQILQETSVNSYGYFEFSGEFLSDTNKIYKIYIDQCNDEITNASHLLKQCDKSNSIVFIANGTDTVHFALNDLNQMFCSFKSSRLENVAIHKIDSVQEVLLSQLQNTKSDSQRNMLFKTYFKELQKFSITLNEPLAELYSYNLYANKKSFARDLYLEDLESSSYYSGLSKRLQKSYPNSRYLSEYENDIKQYNVNFTDNSSNIIIISLSSVLLLSLILNFYLIQKKKVKSSKINYKEILSTQEQNVFELMQKGLSNKEIAEQLFVSISTIKSHINNIYAKLKISSRKDIYRFS